ncbi:MAG: hypothetical protein ACQEQO_10325, partial [Thermodesulfobacteriota bacterium]
FFKGLSLSRDDGPLHATIEIGKVPTPEGTEKKSIIFHMMTGIVTFFKVSYPWGSLPEADKSCPLRGAGSPGRRPPVTSEKTIVFIIVTEIFRFSGYG